MLRTKLFVYNLLANMLCVVPGVGSDKGEQQRSGTGKVTVRETVQWTPHSSRHPWLLGRVLDVESTLNLSDCINFPSREDMATRNWHQVEDCGIFLPSGTCLWSFWQLKLCDLRKANTSLDSSEYRSNQAAIPEYPFERCAQLKMQALRPSLPTNRQN